MEITRHTDEQIEVGTIQRDGQERRIIRGLASVYYDGTPKTEYELEPGIVERIAPGAWSEVLRSDQPVFMAVNHDLDRRVAKTPKTLKLWESDRGLNFEGELNRSTASNDLWEDVKSGVMAGSSFRADMDKGTVKWSREGKKDVITITRFTRLKEVSPCYSGAYKAGNSEAIIRSHEEWLADEATKERLERWNKIKSKCIDNPNASK